MVLSQPHLRCSEIDASRVVWTLRSIARRERRRGADARRLTEPGLRRWKAFAGARLHAGDLVALALQNAATINPLGYRLPRALDAGGAEDLLAEAYDDAKWQTAGVGEFLEGLAVAFGRPALTPQRRSAFGPIRADQRILEFPSTAARIAASVAPKDAPLETYVSYVVADDVDRFIVGCALAEFERAIAPTLIDVGALERGERDGLTAAFTKAATLVPDEPLAQLFPPAAIGDRLIVL